jgi:hypothetical protein
MGQNKTSVMMDIPVVDRRVGSFDPGVGAMAGLIDRIPSFLEREVVCSVVFPMHPSTSTATK